MTLNASVFDLYQIFYATEIWGLIGPFAMVLVGWYLGKKEKLLAALWYILMLWQVQYYLVDAAAYPVHVFTMIFGGAIVCIINPFFQSR